MKRIIASHCPRAGLRARGEGPGRDRPVTHHLPAAAGVRPRTAGLDRLVDERIFQRHQEPRHTRLPIRGTKPAGRRQLLQDPQVGNRHERNAEALALAPPRGQLLNAPVSSAPESRDDTPYPLQYRRGHGPDGATLSFACQNRLPAISNARPLPHSSKSAWSAPANAIDRAATVHGCAGGHHRRACNRPRAQHDTGPCDAARRVADIRAVNDGAGRFRACGHEAGNQHCRCR